MTTPPDTHPSGWDLAVSRYRTALRAAGRAPGTVKLHEHYLRLLRRQCPDPWSVTTADLLEFLAVERWEPETRKSARMVVRGFYRWAHGSEIVEHDPAEALPGVKVPPGKPQPVPDSIVYDLTNSRDRRLAFMALLGAVACLRVGEISRVHGDDLVGSTLYVRGKGGKVRTVPIDDEVLLAMLRAVGSHWAFPSPKGGHLTAGHVSRLLSRALPHRYTGHKLRHRGASAALDGTGNLLWVMEYLGHSRPETTIRYTLSTANNLRACAAATAINRPPSAAA